MRYLSLFVFFAFSAFANYPITETIKETESRYTKLLLDILSQWPPKGLMYEGEEGRALHLRVFETPKNEDYIGVEQAMVVKAPLAKVVAVIDAFENYDKLFPGFADIHVVSTDKNRFDVYWENIIPVFFIPNVKFVTTYTVDKSQPNRKIYRSQLKKKGGLRASDTLIVVEAVGENTKFTEFDFFDGDFGVLKQLAGDRIWKESVEAVAMADLAIKIKAENTDLPYEDIRSSIKNLIETYPVPKLIREKKPYPFPDGI